VGFRASPLPIVIAGVIRNYYLLSMLSRFVIKNATFLPCIKKANLEFVVKMLSNCVNRNKNI
jgi:hypothetical protein